MYRFLIVLLLFASIKIYSQPVANNPIGPISDVPSGTLSGVTIGLNLALKGREETTEQRTQDFLKEYRKRLQYYGGFAWLSTVNDIINNVKGRSRQLRQYNEKLSFLYYSKKKENMMYLLSADKQIENMSSNFLSSEVNTILGEKFNLYENLRTSLSAINRKLDRVDDNIKESNLKRKFVQQSVK
ncbi:MULTISPECIES: hypothetical protein [unclassified Chryseobacterium]|uniref:hypothetical protein n=1 Tax=unclassified Chryseobacterium TaxID=2593645 RepID=UPI0009550D15|nr:MULTISPECIES: hypothetical protein [unclassified Chryseobacterium]SIR72358.1 hypothetical protein SAMN05880573_13813 [Chryseobacterium sp. RU33C]